MILAIKLSVYKKICSFKTLNELLKDLYDQNNLDYTFKKYSKKNKWIKSLIPYLKNDKKNNDDEKINFILLKRIGKTTLPNKFKISVKILKNIQKLLLNTNF